MTSCRSPISSNLRPIAAGLLLVYVGLHGHDLFAASVTSCADDDGFDTLRHAVFTAGPGETIKLSGLACSKITLAKGPLVVGLDDLAIDGPGAAQLTIEGNGVDRVFEHTGMGTLTLDRVTVAGGVVKMDKAYGGCITATAA